MFCTTIIPTIGRPSLSRAVNSVLVQSLPGADFEVIVVNDSGRPLPAEDWQQDMRVQVVTTQHRERAVARNMGAAMAHGRYLHFLDDDDWLAPGALAHFWKHLAATDSGWFYGVSQLVDRKGRSIIQLHHWLDGNCFLQVMAGEWIPLQASLIAADAFFDVGGFNPLLVGPEDIDLLRRVALKYDIAGMEEVVAFIERGEEGSTTDYDRHPQRSRRAREGILDEAAAFNRLRSMATDPYWRGRLVRIYATSAVWNLGHWRLLAAISRSYYALRGMVAGGEQLLSLAFWRSLAHAYESPTFLRGEREAAAALSTAAGPSTSER